MLRQIRKNSSGTGDDARQFDNGPCLDGQTRESKLRELRETYSFIRKLPMKFSQSVRSEDVEMKGSQGFGGEEGRLMSLTLWITSTLTAKTTLLYVVVGQGWIVLSNGKWINRPKMTEGLVGTSR